MDRYLFAFLHVGNVFHSMFSLAHAFIVKITPTISLGFTLFFLGHPIIFPSWPFGEISSLSSSSVSQAFKMSLNYPKTLDLFSVPVGLHWRKATCCVQHMVGLYQRPQKRNTTPVVSVWSWKCRRLSWCLISTRAISQIVWNCSLLVLISWNAWKLCLNEQSFLGIPQMGLSETMTSQRPTWLVLLQVLEWLEWFNFCFATSKRLHTNELVLLIWCLSCLAYHRLPT